MQPATTHIHRQATTLQGESVATAPELRDTLRQLSRRSAEVELLADLIGKHLQTHAQASGLG